MPEDNDRIWDWLAVPGRTFSLRGVVYKITEDTGECDCADCDLPLGHPKTQEGLT